MKLYFLFILLIILNIVNTTEDFTADYIGDVDNFNIIYNLYSESADSQIKKLLEEDPERIIPMKNVDQEEYKCVLPVIEHVTQKLIDEYRGPTPAELVQPLSDDKLTSVYSSNGYWIYDLAHGNYILQYHEDRETKQRTEYSLGVFRADQVKQDMKKFDQLKPPKTKIREVDYAYYPVHFRHGSPCDLTGRPRETKIMYVCYEATKHMIYSINEVQTCHYEVVVLTNLLCGHPAFQPHTIPEHEIKCYASDKQKSAKPRNLQEIEKELFAETFEQYSRNSDSTTVPHKSAVFNKLVSPDVQNTFGRKGPVELEEKKLDAGDGLDELLTDELKKLMDVYMQTKNPDSLLPALRRIDDSLNEDDIDMILDFWLGKSCFVGGQGYWKYEFCFNGKITQFHVENFSREKEIVLGEFNRERHMEWFNKNKEKAIKREKDIVKEVQYFYDNGDFCQESNAKRHVLVKIVCRIPDGNSPISTVLISVEESTPCSYLLTLESPLLCEGLQEIDEAGVYDLNKEFEDSHKYFKESGLDKVQKEFHEAVDRHKKGEEFKIDPEFSKTFAEAMETLKALRSENEKNERNKKKTKPSN